VNSFSSGCQHLPARASAFERGDRLAACNVIVMMMAADHVFARLVGDLLDLVAPGRNCLRTGKFDGISAL
jgi:hypothetical protein